MNIKNDNWFNINPTVVIRPSNNNEIVITYKKYIKTRIIDLCRNAHRNDEKSDKEAIAIQPIINKNTI